MRDSSFDRTVERAFARPVRNRRLATRTASLQARRDGAEGCEPEGSRSTSIRERPPRQPHPARRRHKTHRRKSAGEPDEAVRK